MQKRNAANALRVIMVAAGLCAASACTSAVPAQVKATPAPAPGFIPADFAPPTRVAAQGFTLVPLGPEIVAQDYAAYMSSIEHLQRTFTRSTAWPRADLTLADSMADMESEAARFAARQSFAYGVLTPNGQHELGSVYVRPSPVAGYDAVVMLWVTEPQYEAGFDAVLESWVRDWVAREWPFARVAYPGRDIDWKTWDALTGKPGG